MISNTNREVTNYLTNEVLHPAASETLQRMLKASGAEYRTMRATFTERDKASFKAVHEDSGSGFVARCFGQTLYLIVENHGVDIAIEDRSGAVHPVGTVAASAPLEQLEEIVRTFVESAFQESGLVEMVWDCSRSMHRAILGGGGSDV